jgi:hypothetical protein
MSGERAKPSAEETLRFRVDRAERLFRPKNEKGTVQGRSLSREALGGRSPRDGKAQESRTVPTWIKRLGSKEGTRLGGWEQAAEAPTEGREVFRKSARAERGEETLLRSSTWRKALKGEAQERPKLKEASTDLRVKKMTHREGSQTLGWDFSGA